MKKDFATYAPKLLEMNPDLTLEAGDEDEGDGISVTGTQLLTENE